MSEIGVSAAAPTTSADGRASRAAFAGLVLGLIGLQFVAAWPINVLPMANGALIDHRGFSPTTAGALASIELLCFSIALIMLPPLMRRCDSRTVGIIGLILCAGGNAATAFLADALLMAPARLLVGLGTGLAALAATTAIAGTGDVGRVATWLSLTTAVLIALGVLVAGYVISIGGAEGLFLFLAAVPLVAILSAGRPPPKLARADAPPTSWRRSLVSGPTLASILSLFAAAVVWAFAERIGVGMGLSIPAIGALLALVSLAGVAGGGAAIACSRWGRDRACAIVGIILLGLSSAAIPLAFAVWFYAAALAGQLFFFVFVNPFLLAIACREDPTGALAARMLGLTSLVAAFAPTIAGVLLELGQMSYLALAPTICTPLAVLALSRTGRSARA